MNNALQLSLQGIVFRASDRRQSIDTDCSGGFFHAGPLAPRVGAQPTRSNTAKLSVWAVCGNMFTTPAVLQR
jgi:hypothetical protein